MCERKVESQSSKRLRISELNPHLLCALCGGYLIDATTIIECLHAFCKTCILRYLETSNYCPICEVLIHKTRPWQNIRLDHSLQNAVYKMVPGLFQNEMKRRREFYEKLNQTDKKVWSCSQPQEELGDRIIFSQDEQFSISIEFSPDGQPLKESSVTLQKRQKCTYQPEKRYLQCPAALRVEHLKKFIRAKFSLPPYIQIDLFLDKDPLCDTYTLMDVAYIYLWKRDCVLRLFYSFYEIPQKIRKLETVTVAEKVNKKSREKKEEKAQKRKTERKSKSRKEKSQDKKQCKVTESATSVMTVGQAQGDQNTQKLKRKHSDSKPREADLQPAKLTKSSLNGLSVHSKGPPFKQKCPPEVASYSIIQATNVKEKSKSVKDAGKAKTGLKLLIKSSQVKPAKDGKKQVEKNSLSKSNLFERMDSLSKFSLPDQVDKPELSAILASPQQMFQCQNVKKVKVKKIDKCHKATLYSPMVSEKAKLGMSPLEIPGVFVEANILTSVHCDQQQKSLELSNNVLPVPPTKTPVSEIKTELLSESKPSDVASQMEKSNHTAELYSRDEPINLSSSAKTADFCLAHSQESSRGQFQVTPEGRQRSPEEIKRRKMEDPVKKHTACSNVNYAAEDKVMAQDKDVITASQGADPLGSTTEEGKVGINLNSKESCLKAENKKYELARDNKKLELIVDNTKSEIIVENKKSGIIIENKKFRIIAENKKSGIIADNKKSGIIAGNTESGIIAENKKSGIIADNKKSGIIAGNTESGIIADNKKSGIIAGNTESGIIAENKRYGIIADNIKSGIIADNKKSGFIADNKKSGIIADNTKSGIVLENKKPEIILDNKTNVTCISPQDFKLIDKDILKQEIVKSEMCKLETNGVSEISQSKDCKLESEVCSFLNGSCVQLACGQTRTVENNNIKETLSSDPDIQIPSVDFQSSPKDIQSQPKDIKSPPKEMQSPPKEMQSPPKEMQSPPSEIQIQPMLVQMPPASVAKESHESNKAILKMGAKNDSCTNNGNASPQSLPEPPMLVTVTSSSLSYSIAPIVSVANTAQQFSTSSLSFSKPISSHSTNTTSSSVSRIDITPKPISPVPSNTKPFTDAGQQASAPLESQTSGHKPSEASSTPASLPTKGVGNVQQSENTDSRTSCVSPDPISPILSNGSIHLSVKSPPSLSIPSPLTHSSPTPNSPIHLTAPSIDNTFLIAPPPATSESVTKLTPKLPIDTTTITLRIPKEAINVDNFLFDTKPSEKDSPKANRSPKHQQLSPPTKQSSKNVLKSKPESPTDEPLDRSLKSKETQLTAVHQLPKTISQTSKSYSVARSATASPSSASRANTIQTTKISTLIPKSNSVTSKSSMYTKSFSYPTTINSVPSSRSFLHTALPHPLSRPDINTLINGAAAAGYQRAMMDKASALFAHSSSKSTASSPCVPHPRTGPKHCSRDGESKPEKPVKGKGVPPLTIPKATLGSTTLKLQRSPGSTDHYIFAPVNHFGLSGHPNGGEKSRSSGKEKPTNSKVITSPSISAKDSTYHGERQRVPSIKISDINRNPIIVDSGISSHVAPQFRSYNHAASRAPMENGSSRGGHQRSGSDCGSPSSVGSGAGSNRPAPRDSRRPSDSELLLNPHWHHSYTTADLLFNGFKLPTHPKFHDLHYDTDAMPLDYSQSSSKS